MERYAYWFRLTDFSGNPFPDARPDVWVEGEKGVFGPDGVLAPRRSPVTVTEGGAAVVYLFASTDTSPPVTYTLKCRWLVTRASDGKEISAGLGQWQFVALAGGGDIKDMVDAPPSVVFEGPPWPDRPYPGVYFDRDTNDLWKVEP